MAAQKILVVEDERKIAEIVSAYLTREGFAVTVAETGQNALSAVKTGFDLVILDLMLPDISGEEVCSAVREHSDIPIIMLTAKSEEEDRVRGLGIGADDYVVKPFSPRELTARVKAHLRRTGERRKNISFNRGKLSLDPDRFEVCRNGVPVELTSTEFRLLHYLAKRPGQVFSRLQLVTVILGYDFEGYDRTIDTHIKNIRHKIEDNPRKPSFIKTVYGAGYKFIGQSDED